MKRKHISGDWPSWKHYWYSWVLSAWQAHETQSRIDLVTDSKGAEILVEQQTAYCVARQQGANIHTLFKEVDPNKLSDAAKTVGYTHVMGSKKKPADHEFMLRLQKRVREVSLDAYERIQKGFSLTGGCRVTKPTHEPSVIRKDMNVIKHVSHAGVSVAKTSLGINRASDEQVKARLAVCEKCPGDHAIGRNGKLYTCGSMLESMKHEGQGACGCVLNLKARDISEECPFGWWEFK